MLADAIKAEISPEYLRELVAQVKTMQKHTRAWCPNCEQHVTVLVPDLPKVVARGSEMSISKRPAHKLIPWSGYKPKPEAKAVGGKRPAKG
jgi:ribosomal protein L44E